MTKRSKHAMKYAWICGACLLGLVSAAAEMVYSCTAAFNRGLEDSWLLDKTPPALSMKSNADNARSNTDRVALDSDKHCKYSSMS